LVSGGSIGPLDPPLAPTDTSSLKFTQTLNVDCLFFPNCFMPLLNSHLRMDVGKILPGGATVDFSRGSQKKFQGVMAQCGEFFHTLKTKKTTFLLKM